MRQDHVGKKRLRNVTHRPHYGVAVGEECIITDTMPQPSRRGIVGRHNVKGSYRATVGYGDKQCGVLPGRQRANEAHTHTHIQIYTYTHFPGIPSSAYTNSTRLKYLLYTYCRCLHHLSREKTILVYSRCRFPLGAVYPPLYCRTTIKIWPKNAKKQTQFNKLKDYVSIVLVK